MVIGTVFVILLRDQELHLGLEVMSLTTYCSSIPHEEVYNT
ncbi:MAG: hypothetical protein UX72_C0008G0028 [Parcubacteria group bacterium GW2011_GWA2_47_10]|nr:MAG: hypothetical protein UX72_C0008G0028 [Parcubacteria group bacterium GW2011_GWA2_47_10]